MRPISVAEIERTLDSITGMSPDDAKVQVRRMTREQPVVQAYLVAVGLTAGLNRVETNLVINMGVAVWRIFDEACGPLPSVSEDTLNRVRESNSRQVASEFWSLALASQQSVEATAVLLGRGQDPLGDFHRLVDFLSEDHGQRTMLRFFARDLARAAEPENEVGVRSLSLVDMLRYVKTLVDCFDQSG